MCDTTHIIYKATLTQWFKGTGRGSGFTIMFEGWSDEKLSKYNMDLDNYDHTDVSSRPIILIQGYAKQRTPF